MDKKINTNKYRLLGKRQPQRLKLKERQTNKETTEDDKKDNIRYSAILTDAYADSRKGNN